MVEAHKKASIQVSNTQVHGIWATGSCSIGYANMCGYVVSLDPQGKGSSDPVQIERWPGSCVFSNMKGPLTVIRVIRIGILGVRLSSFQGPYPGPYTLNPKQEAELRGSVFRRLVGRFASNAGMTVDRTYPLSLNKHGAPS